MPDATHIYFSLQQVHRNICLTISDNGLGFDEQTVQKGNGLNNIRERARQIRWKSTSSLPQKRNANNHYKILKYK